MKINMQFTGTYSLGGRMVQDFSSLIIKVFKVETPFRILDKLSIRIVVLLFKLLQ